jgi:hypothetical protein
VSVGVGFKGWEFSENNLETAGEKASAMFSIQGYDDDDDDDEFIPDLAN